VRRLCQTVVPVAGLLAQSGSTLRESEYRALEVLARAPLEEVEPLLLSAGRFAETPSPLLDPAERVALLVRLGVFGVRLAVDLIAGGVVASGPQLATELVARSGLTELRQVLATQFAARRDVLKSRSALLALEAVLDDLPLPAPGRLAGEFERVSAGAHEFVELRLLNGLRRGGARLPAVDMEEIERLLGGSGPSSPARLGLPAGADGDDLDRELASVIARWQRRAESPMSNRQMADAARVVVRTCEGLHAALA
jgi:hypothetical protein